MKSLICFNTYKSPELVKSFIWDYINFTHDNPMYDFIVSLDGEDKETIKYCKKFSIPLLFNQNETVQFTYKSLSVTSTSNSVVNDE